jgi:hypothetical protein
MEAAKAGLSAERIGSRIPAMIEPTEGAGMPAVALKSLMPAKIPPMKAAATIEVRSTRTKTIAIDDSPAMRDVGVVVVDDPAAAVPVESPTVPTPAEASKESNPET